MEPKFIVDANAGKLVKWLRMMGFDTIFFDEPDDGGMVKVALAEGRIVITKDSEFIKRRSISSGRVKAILVKGDSSEDQMRNVTSTLDLIYRERPFTRCLECNTVLERMEREKAEKLVPARVAEIQDQYMACPTCRRIYWRGTHWKAMSDKLCEFAAARLQENEGEHR